jgi:hypothetical protein
MNLLDTTLDLARTTEVPISQICKEIDVTPRWLQKLLVSEIKDPSVRRIQRLHDYLQTQHD